ncbi:fused permease component [Pseudomonas syringae pv. actinidiae]|uniref:Fused permease component n=1 Tax=Pseudomonas syringae pv. actinidiae TaxID=103796 RepID=A0AAN4Q6J4_PSESF|nr:fused permease component [Pseudomonas syringae pv. actinidiae]
MNGCLFLKPLWLSFRKLAAYFRPSLVLRRVPTSRWADYSEHEHVHRIWRFQAKAINANRSRRRSVPVRLAYD